jgi:hypothetical protein
MYKIMVLDQFSALLPLPSSTQNLMAEQGSASGSAKAGAAENASMLAISTIDDVVSLIRSVEAAPDTTQTSGSNLVSIAVYNTLLPALKRQYHAQKGKGQRVFLQALQGGIDPLSMLNPAHNSLGYAYIL